MKSVLLLVAAASLAISTTPIQAQSPRHSRTMRPISQAVASTPVSTPMVVGGSYDLPSGAWQSHASTVAESEYRGWADAVRGAGEYARDIAAAQIDLETARQMAIENHALRVRTTWQIRDEHLARDKAEHPTLTTEQHRYITRSRDPQRLSFSQLSPNGVIAWPTALQAPEFAAARENLDALFAERARAVSSDANAELAQRIDAEAISLAAALADSTADVPVMAKVNAKNFVNALRLEARQSRNDATGRQVASATNRR